MKILHLISGGDTGGAKTAVSILLTALAENKSIYVMVACFVDGAFYKEMKTTDIPSVLYEQSNRYDMRVIGKLKKLICEKGFDIIHAHGPRANFIALCLKPFIHIPIITTMHSDYKMDFTIGVYKRFFGFFDSFKRGLIVGRRFFMRVMYFYGRVVIFAFGDLHAFGNVHKHRPFASALGNDEGFF